MDRVDLQVREVKRQLSQYFKNNKEDFEDRLELYKKTSIFFKESSRWILDGQKFSVSSKFIDIAREYLDFKKAEMIDYSRLFYLHEEEIEAKIEEFGFDANISQEEYLKLFPKNTFAEAMFSYEVFHLFLKAREEWVKSNLGYFIHDW